MLASFPNGLKSNSHTANQISSNIVIARPASELFTLWRKPETLPILMGHVAHIDIINNTDSRWRMKAPLGLYIEWLARIADEKNGELIYWHSLPGARIPNEGRLTFQSISDQVTEVTLTIRFEPPGGFLGKTLGQMFQLLPKEMLHKTLRRFKSLAENGVIPPAL
ncbi:SRPBCC family protein [Musicola keenii]|uniref:SRPBCC family protein n=1 Tax=Musicola keenii TaxID=2884250 RepID=UPI001781F909